MSYLFLKTVVIHIGMTSTDSYVLMFGQKKLELLRHVSLLEEVDVLEL